MSYIDTYKLRLGERVSTELTDLKNKSNVYFVRYQKRSPNKVSFNYNGQEQPGVLLSASNNQNEKKFYCYLLTDLNTDLPNGTIVQIRSNRWLVLHKDQHEYNCYYRYKVILLNYSLSYIDNTGKTATLWGYLVSTADKDIKELFKMSEGLVAELPNDKIQLVCAAQTNVAKDTRFIIQDEAWVLTPIDKVSINGVWYTALKRTQKDTAYDTTIADSLNPVKTTDGNEVIIGPNRVRITEKIKVTINFVGNYTIELSNNLLSYSWENDKLVLTAGKQMGTCTVSVKANGTVVSTKQITIVNIWSK